MKNKKYDKKMFRLMFILNQLSKNGHVKTAELAEEFNTNIRTVQRDIFLLEQVGFPLDGDSGEYKFVEGFSLRKISVSPDEKYLLTILYRLFAGAEGPLQSSANNLLSKVLITSASQEDCPEFMSDKLKEVMERKIEDVSKEIRVLCQDEPQSQALQDKVKRFVKEIESKVAAINKRDKVELKVVKKIDHKSPHVFCVLKVPKSYVSIPEAHLFFGAPQFSIGDLKTDRFYDALKQLRRTDRFFLELLGVDVGDVQSCSEEKLVAALNQMIKIRDFYAKAEGDYSRDQLPEEIRILLDKAGNKKIEMAEQDCIQLNKALWMELYPKMIRLTGSSFDPSIYYEVRFFEVYPDKSFPDFRIGAKAEIYYRFWGPFIELKKFDFLDSLMEEMGFPAADKRVDYEYSYGGSYLHITRLGISWERKIDLPDSEKAPFMKLKKLVMHGGSDHYDVE